MLSGAGVALIAVGSVISLFTGLVLRTRLSTAGVVAIVAASGISVGVGALLVQRDPGVVDWVVTLASLAVLAPVHARVMLGRLGRSEGDRGVPG